MELQDRFCAAPGCGVKLDPRNRTGLCRSHRERTPHAGQFTPETARAARAARKAKSETPEIACPRVLTLPASRSTIHVQG